MVLQEFQSNHVIMTLKVPVEWGFWSWHRIRLSRIEFDVKLKTLIKWHL